MNEGENSGMPNTPVFSSPNTSPNERPAQPAAPTESNASVIAAAASLPGEDPSQPAGVISSGDSTPAGARPRFGFSRKFKAKSDTQPAQTAFNNAPDYFNRAVADITIAGENAIAKAQKTKRIAIIAGSALAAIVCVVVVAAVIGQINKPNANKVKTAFNRYANYVLYGEEKDSDIGEYSTSIRYTIMDKYINVDEGYNNHFKELFDKFYQEYNAAAENGLYEKGKIDGYKNTIYGVYSSFNLENRFDEDTLRERIINSGYDAAMDEINKAANRFMLAEDSRYVSSWVNAKKALADSLDYLKGKGCFDLSLEEGAGCGLDGTYGGLVETYSTLSAQVFKEKEFERKLLYDQIFNIRGIINES